MNILFSKRGPYLVLAVVVGLVILGVIVNAVITGSGPEQETAVVSRGDVSVFVSVSGNVRTPNTAVLGFPTSGVISDVPVREGDVVTKGTVLATLGQSALVADYNDALAYLAIQEAYRTELLAGPRNESRDVIKTTVEIAEAELARTIAEEDESVAGALRTLYSSGLEAVPARAETDDVPPTISGTYTCDMPTTYRFEVYPSNAQSGRSFRMIEGGTAVGSAVTESATPFGDCGLFIRFDSNETYGNREWIVEVPNKRAATYAAQVSSYNLALQQRENAIDAATQNLAKAREEGALDVAQPRPEELARANANVAQAQARLAAIEANIADVAIRAPFDGVVTSVAIAPGEIGSATTGITITADDSYELKIRIPEIDITKIEEGDRAHASFDARPEEIVTATVSFISPLPTEIDGVAYYEATLEITDAPAWMRTGLNADVDVVIEEVRDVLTVPKRFIMYESDSAYVLRQNNGDPTPVTITVGLIGNDGRAEITGIDEGATIVAP